VFLPGRTFQPSPVFRSIAETYPSEAFSGANIRQSRKAFVSDQHPSLLSTIISYDSKKFYNVDPGANSGWTETLDLRRLKQVFYNCSTATGQHFCNFLSPSASGDLWMLRQVFNNCTTATSTLLSFPLLQCLL
jgi:hypothetical protein